MLWKMEGRRGVGVTLHESFNCSSNSSHVNKQCERRKRVARRYPTSTPLYYVGIILLLIGIGHALEPPDIIPNDETVTIERGQTLQLVCQGDEELSWNSTSLLLPETDERVNITNSKVEGTSSRPFLSTLTLSNIGHKDVGWYTCSYAGNASDASNEITEDTILVHVRDEDHLLRYENPPKILLVSEIGFPLYIPCLPTWPEVKIEISHDGNPIQLDENNYSIRGGGYKIQLLTKKHDGLYSCTATYSETKEERTFSVFTTNRQPTPGIIYFPRMKVTNGGSIGVGDNFEIVCYTQQKPGVYFSLELNGPNTTDSSRVTKTERDDDEEYFNNSPEYQGWKRWLIKYRVKGARKEDTGSYSCTVKPVGGEPKSRTTNLRVYDNKETFLEVATGLETIYVPEGQPAKWVINITSFPSHDKPIWKNPKGEEIPLNNKNYRFQNTSRDNEYVLEVVHAVLEDTGSYPLTVRLPRQYAQEATLNLSLFVKARPKVEIKTNGPKSYFLADESYELTCIVRGYPSPNAFWSYEECNGVLACTRAKNITELRRREIKNGFESIIKVTANGYGRYSCIASNVMGKASKQQIIRVVDYNGDAEIFIKTPDEVVQGDDTELICSLSKLNNSEADLVWLYDVGGFKQPIKDAIVKSDDTKWSWKKILTFNSIQNSSSGKYVCKNSKGNQVETSVILDVLTASAPQFIDSLNNSQVILKLGDTINLTCDAEGKPKPSILWTWESHPVDEWPIDMKYHFSLDKKVLYLTYLPEDAHGRFMCEAENRNGSVSAFIDISVPASKSLSIVVVGVILALIFLVIVFGVIVAKYKYDKDKWKRFMVEIDQKGFYDGAVDQINNELSVADQAYLLPFDTRWEFPKDRLKMSIQLGSGAFGRVVKADALGILENESTTTVAVKMVKPNADETHFKALMSELKIMVHLGKHLNVVNLLGACTKNLAKKKELFVIVEYCKYGSLLSYMHRHRRTFINQLDPARGFINPNIDRCTERNENQPRIHYAQLTFTDPGNSRAPASNGYRTLEEFNEPTPVDDPPTPTLRPIEPVLTPSENGYPLRDFLAQGRGGTEHYVAESQVESTCTGISYLSNGHTMMATDGTTKRRSSCGSQWPDQDHYRGDYQVREVRPIRTTDLLSWAFQIARGMEYLATRKVLHGDLAARNVLLAENNVVKICDFGLAKEMYKDYKYKKKSEGVLLPVKWMAIESIYYGVFSTQSDCWSFGVVLWELFTLGKTPYPGMEADEKFYKRISEGYRMEKPPLAPSCVYDIMLECWAQEPTERPTFPGLVDRIGDMMEEGLRNHYIDLNSAYMKINQEALAGGPDYLSQMGRSEFATDLQYQNVPEEDASGYLKPIIPGEAVPKSPPHYQNIPNPQVEPSCSMLANNNGYMFVKTPAVIETPEMTEDADEQPSCTLQIRYSPDIKEVYGLRDPSPDIYSFSNMVESSETPPKENHISIHLGSNGMPGIDNMNYVPNHLLFTKPPPSSPKASPTEEKEGKDIIRKSTESSNGRRQNRQKNDSGLGSIDSNQFESQHGPLTPQIPEHCNDFTHLQQPNGYVSHQNISSFS